MTPQAILRARFDELAESLGLTLAVRRQTGKFYVTGDWEARGRSGVCRLKAGLQTISARS